MKKFAAVFLSSLLPTVSSAEEPLPAYEMPRTQVVAIEDSKTERQYELYIKLPEGYDQDKDESYPVIYATDGIWHMDMLSGATEYLISNTILVGISWQKDIEAEEEFASRFRDYTVTAYSDPEVQSQYQGGEASTHLAFIQGDVIPYVEGNYRTETDQRTYFGYSLGGAFGAYVVLAAPDTFNNYVLGSPAVGPKSVAYFNELQAKMSKRQQELNAKVFVSIGELEERSMGVTEELFSVLKRQEEAGLNLTGLEVITDSDHTTAFPETVLRSLKWLMALSAESASFDD